jgi:hypothetical protein
LTINDANLLSQSKVQNEGRKTKIKETKIESKLTLLLSVMIPITIIFMYE